MTTTLPAPLSTTAYRDIRTAMLADPDWAPQIEWSETVGRPSSAEDMAIELCWVILNSGFSAATARKLWPALLPWIEAQDRVAALQVFGHAGKVGAMLDVWASREALFEELQEIGDEDLPAWCEQLPYIGPITRWHAAKNLGADVAKPDRWIVRLAEHHGEPIARMMQRLSDASGDRVRTVDLVLWWGCSNGLLLPKSRPPPG